MGDISVLIVDDHGVVRRGLRSFLESEEDIRVVGEAANGAEAIEKVRSLSPDVVLMDLVMPGMDGIATTRQITQLCPETRVLVLTSFSDDDKVFPALEAGAMGYLLKDIPAEDLGRAIRTVAAGEFLLNSKVAGKVIRGFRPSAEAEPSEESASTMGDLTHREIEVLTLIARGCTNKEISVELCITVRTVKAHVSNILAKLNATDRLQAALLAIQEGWVPAS